MEEVPEVECLEERLLYEHNIVEYELRGLREVGVPVRGAKCEAQCVKEHEGEDGDPTPRSEI